MGEFSTFCGSKIWNESLTWNTSLHGLPDLTLCLDNLLTWVPCAFLIILSPFYLLYLLKSRSPLTVDASTLNVVKTVLCILLSIISLIDLVNFVDKAHPYHIVYVTSGVEIFCMLVAAGFTQLYRRKGHVTSAILFMYWTLFFFAVALRLYSEIKHYIEAGEPDDGINFLTVCLRFALIIFQFLFSLLGDVSSTLAWRYRNVCPEVLASFPSYLTYHWFTQVVSTGYKKDLEEDDLWKLGHRDQTESHVPAFEKVWNDAIAEWRVKMAEVERTKSRRGDPSLNASTAEPSESTPILNPQVAIKGKEPKKPGLSLMRSYMKVYGYLILLAWLCKFLCDWLKFVDPQIQKALINFVSDGGKQPYWRGYMFASGFIFSQLIQTALFQQLFYLGGLAGMQAKAALIHVIYKKSITMSNQARQQSTVGEIVNLMSVDAQRIQDVSGYIWIVWSAPLQIALALWQLYETIGPSMFAGFGIMMLTIPVNGIVAAKQRGYQVLQMKFKDDRIKLMNEVLGGIKIIKLYAWEPSFEEKVKIIRDKEIDVIRKGWYLRSISIFSWTVIPFLVTLTTFGVYIATNEKSFLTPDVAFVSLSLFNILRAPLNLLPMLVSFIVMASVSVQRICKFFQTTDLDSGNVIHDRHAPHSVSVKNGTFAWLPDSDPVLKRINFEVPIGHLIAVVGQVGCGKSSLLASCIGDLEKKEGSVTIKNSVAYVSQQAWIQNATLRDNILFGREFDERLYRKSIDACALASDLEILDNGDMTLIGEKGINLSGGQKQRVSLARAVYNNADIYLLDDPLSAVDSHVGKHIFEQVIGPNGILRDKTRVLVTHGVQWLPYVDNISVMTSGQISEVGTYDELLGHDGVFAQFLKSYFIGEKAEVDADEDEHPEVNAIKEQILQRLDSVVSQSEHSGDELRKSPYMTTKSLRRQKSTFSEAGRRRSRSSTVRGKSVTDISAVKKPVEKKVTDHETVETGQVAMTVYLEYVRALTFQRSIPCIVAILCYTGMTLFGNIWLSKWTGDVDINNASSHLNQGAFSGLISDAKSKQSYYIGIYGLIGALQAALILTYSLFFASANIQASKFMHERLLKRMMRATMAFFDTKPLGMILNRFSKDIDTIDNNLGFTVFQTFTNFLSVSGTVIVIAYSTPIFLAMVIPIGILYYFIQRFFIPTTRQLKRLESVTRSPIYTHFSETLNGTTTIRAYRHEKRFIQYSDDAVEKNIVFYFAGWTANRWLAIRLEVIGAFIVFGTALFSVLSLQFSIGNLEASLVGLAITYALQSTTSLNFLIRNLSDMEANIVSVERVKEYSHVPTEAAWITKHNPPPPSWPQHGQITINGYSARYRAELSLVLKSLTCKINPEEKIGIVGRTGAGKSSLTVSLFRLIEGAGGSITIDGVDIASIGLHQLRNKLTILPQDPILFAGSMRANLDPFNNYSDDRIWDALEKSHLKEFITSQASRLDHDVGEGGTNLSVGQRQLVCLARSLLRKTKVLILDEATAAVDLETDSLIQETIRVAFADCTILTIAHRLNTIMDSDRILVLDKGEVVEFDSPKDLLENKSSIFYGMVKDAGLVNGS